MASISKQAFKLLALSSRRGLQLPSSRSLLLERGLASRVEAEGRGPRVLITGGLGQLGRGLAKALRTKYGTENVILSDIVRPTAEMQPEISPYMYVDVMDLKHLHSIVVDHNIDWVVHFSALLSAIAEKDVPKAVELNILGFNNMAELSKSHGLRLFCPSTIGAFGPSTPRKLCPDLTIQRPRTIYGVSKVYMELLGEYYHHKYGVDFRSLRLPGVLSADTPPGGGTTDYAVHIFHEAARHNRYTCFLKPDTRLPMIYLPDCVNGIVSFLETPNEKLQSEMRTYNIQAVSFTPAELVQEMRRQHFPSLDVDYQPDQRQDIADSWPDVLDDSCARADWGWSHEYDLTRMVAEMAERIKATC